MYALADFGVDGATLSLLLVQLWVLVGVVRSRGSFSEKGMWIVFVLLFQLAACVFWFILKED